MLQARSLQRDTIEQVGRQWRDRLRSADTLKPAQEIYCGRSFLEAQRAAHVTGAQLYIVSAGLGLVGQDDLIPSYSLTASPGSEDSVSEKCSGPFSPSEWWDMGTAQSPFARDLNKVLNINEAPEDLILVSLPSAYLRMIGARLAQLPDDLLLRLRVFSGGDLGGIDARLRQLVMPYDGRLDGPDSASPGTLSDFASRALVDFVSWVLPTLPRAGAQEHRNAVAGRLQGWRHPSRPKRDRYEDEHLLALIRQNQSSATAGAGQMLRLFRDRLGIACEQKRFSRLYAQAATEKGGA